MQNNVKTLDYLQDNPDMPCFLRARDLCVFGRELIQEARAEFEREQQILSKLKEDDLLLPETVMAIGHISRATLYRLAKAGILVPVRIGGQRRYRRSDLEAYFSR